MTRSASRVLLVVALLACGASSAANAADPRYKASVAIVTEETFTYNLGDPSSDCDGWTHAEGKVRARASASGPLIFASAGGYTVGGLSGSAKSETNVSRLITYKIHTGATTGACRGCGPNSEIGPCVDQAPVPDVNGRSSCPASPTRAYAAARMTFARNGTLQVEGNTPSEKVLRECSRLFPVPPGVPIGSAQLRLQTEKFPGAASKVRRLAKGASTTFRKADRTGGSCGKKKVVMALCTAHETIVVVTRTD